MSNYPRKPKCATGQCNLVSFAGKDGKTYWKCQVCENLGSDPDCKHDQGTEQRVSKQGKTFDACKGCGKYMNAPRSVFSFPTVTQQSNGVTREEFDKLKDALLVLSDKFQRMQQQPHERPGLGRQEATTSAGSGNGAYAGLHTPPTTTIAGEPAAKRIRRDE